MRTHAGNPKMALDTILQKKTDGIPTGLFHVMEHRCIERLAGASPGDYRRDPCGVYLRMLENVGVSLVDQMLEDNPLIMGDRGYEGGGGSATTGGTAILDGIVVDSPEACVEHLETFHFPALEKRIEEFDEAEMIQRVVSEESRGQRIVGERILKAGYEQLVFPVLEYYKYGYGNFFMAYALYPEVMDRLFELQADYAVLKNNAVIKAYRFADLPLFQRLDHDMADSRGLLVSLKSLERSWTHQFARSLKPAVDAGFRLLWHCDGNLMQLFPFLLETGINGFQGFQYEDGMDYVKICRMKDRLGRPLVIEAGVSVTRELPMGTPDDVRNQMRFLVENGPETGLFLSTSSSVAPGTPWENIETMVEGMKYYQTYRR